MSDDQQREEMRPIPDGGLKDAMPSWLKRPPAWRSMPSAEERHERKLPEPDTSEINPKTLVDVSDLPQWLQSIAARGEVPLPEPDEAVGHALEQVQAASARSKSRAEATEPAPDVVESSEVVEDSDQPEAATEPEAAPAVSELASSAPSSSTNGAPGWFWWALASCFALIAALAIIIIYLL